MVMQNNKKVWIVDDDKSIRWVLEKALKSSDIDIESFSHPDEVLVKINVEEPDVIITDIRMPGMDGMETMSQILEEKNDLPVIINSAYSTYQDNFMSWAADAYCVKSSAMTALKKTVEEVLEKRSVTQ